MNGSSSTDRGHHAPAIAFAVGTTATVVALVALVVAGNAGADLFPATGTASQGVADRGVWMAAQAWANALAMTGIGVIFGVAIPLALRNVCSAIDHRRGPEWSSAPPPRPGRVVLVVRAPDRTTESDHGNGRVGP